MAQLTSNVHEMRGRTDVAHIPPVPLWVAIIRIFQLVSNTFVGYYQLLLIHIQDPGYHYPRLDCLCSFCLQSNCKFRYTTDCNQLSAD
jgi:hypothetical protein